MQPKPKPYASPAGQPNGAIKPAHPPMIRSPAEKNRTNAETSKKTAMATFHTILGALKHIGGPEKTWDCLTGNLHEEWQTIKKVWMLRIRKTHPDKGGDTQEFLSVQHAFEALRLVFEGGKVESFSANMSASCGQEGTAASDHVPSWEYYEV